jgi:hypothetical protein
MKFPDRAQLTDDETFIRTRLAMKLICMCFMGNKLKPLQNIMAPHVNQDDHSVAFIVPDDANVHVDTALV